jgi:hypothetical protein
VNRSAGFWLVPSKRLARVCMMLTAMGAILSARSGGHLKEAAYLCPLL